MRGRRVGLIAGVAGAVGSIGYGVYVGLVTGACPIDLGVGRRTRGLGPIVIDIDAPRDVVFDVIAQPYTGRAPRAMRQKVEVLETGDGMVLAAHFTPAGRLVAKTTETVRFDRPTRVDFRLVRGPVPYMTESFVLTEPTDPADGRGRTTRLEYRGEMATDLWGIGRWWGDLVAEQWERAVAETLDAVAEEAARRASRA